MRSALAKTLGVCLAVLLTASVAHAARGAAGNTLIDAIEQAQASNRLTYETAIRYKLYAILSPEKLPDDYRTLETAPIKCGTPIVTEAFSAAPSLSAGFQSELAAMAERPSADSVYPSPGGWFQIHYSLTGTNAVSAVDADSTGFPDFIERLALYFDSSWSHEVETLGWTCPPSDGIAGGDSLYDIYPTSIGFTYGLTMQDQPGPAPWSDYTSYILVHKSFNGFPPNDDPDGDQAGSMKVTAAHEFNHACQFGDSPLHLKTSESWWQELSATWIEDVVYDASNDNYNFLDDYFTVPGVSLYDGSAHKYGAFVFGKQIEETLGGDVIRNAWQGMHYATAVAAIDTALQSEGSSFRSQFRSFASWNYFTGARDLGLHYEDGVAYPMMPITRIESLYPINNRSGASIQAMSQDFIEFLPDGSGKDVVELKFNGANNARWRASFFLTDSLGNLTEIPLTLDTATGDGTIYFGNFNHIARATLVAANVNPTAIQVSYTYSFRFLTRGDLNADGGVNIFDVLYLSDFIYAAGPAPLPIWQVGDMNCTGDLDIIDISMLIDYALKGGPTPCPPLW